MSVADKITPNDVRTYFRNTQPDWPINRKQLHVPCPIHGGVRDSFSVDMETGRWHCHSQCGEGGDIVTLEQRLHGSDISDAIKRVEEIVGTTFTEAKPQQQQQRRKTMNVTATYVYRDEEGKPLSRVLRLEPKDFRQQRFEDGTWKWGMDGVRRVPYNLPELKRASTVFFVEGEKDADRLTALGLTATTSAEGAGKWRQALAAHFAGKRVFVIADCDDAKSQGIKYPGQQHAAQVMRALISVAREVFLIDLTAWEAKDASDFLDKYGPDRFGELANAAKEPMTFDRLAKYELKYANDHDADVAQAVLIPEAVPQPPKPQPQKRPKGSDGRHVNAIAEEILDAHKILSWGKQAVWEYNNVIWTPISRAKVEQWALAAESAFATKRSRRTEIADYIMIKARLESIPWRSGLADHEVPVANGVVSLLDGSIRPHRAEDYLETVMPIRFDPTAKCDLLPKALRVAWEGDPDIEEKLTALQEFFGYVLMAHAKYKKALFLCGAPDSGKSLILDVLRQMVGRGNYCAISVKDMDDSRKLAPIKGKMLNALSELPYNAMIADGGFKTLVSTGDSIQIDEKFEQEEQYTPYAKHVIATNTLPRVNDLTDATYNRMLLIKFNKPIPLEVRDKHLIEKLMKDASGILNWAIEGARRLHENGGEFTVIPESVQEIKQYKSFSNPVNDFLHLQVRKSEGNDISLDELRNRFNPWWGKDRFSLAQIRRCIKSALGKEACDNWTLFNHAWKS